MKFRRIMATIFRAAFVILVIAAISPFALRALNALAFRSRTYNVETVPEKRTAIIFGARVYPSGRLSAMLADRVATGADLYHAGKVDVLLMSGHRGDAWEDEPEAMRRHALSLGVPAEAILTDGAGSRTYDSCYRARRLYGVEEAVLVSQNFHLDRALLLCSALGIDSVGVWADYQRPWGYSQRSLRWSQFREFPATMLAVWDVLTRPVPAQSEALPHDIRPAS